MVTNCMESRTVMIRATSGCRRKARGLPLNPANRKRKRLTRNGFASPPKPRTEADVHDDLVRDASAQGTQPRGGVGTLGARRAREDCHALILQNIAAAAAAPNRCDALDGRARELPLFWPRLRQTPGEWRRPIALHENAPAGLCDVSEAPIRFSVPWSDAKALFRRRPSDRPREQKTCLAREVAVSTKYDTTAGGFEALNASWGRLGNSHRSKASFD